MQPDELFQQTMQLKINTGAWKEVVESGVTSVLERSLKTGSTYFSFITDRSIFAIYVLAIVYFLSWLDATMRRSLFEPRYVDPATCCLVVVLSLRPKFNPECEAVTRYIIFYCTRKFIFYYHSLYRPIAKLPVKSIHSNKYWTEIHVKSFNGTPAQNLCRRIERWHLRSHASLTTGNVLWQSQNWRTLINLSKR